MNELIVGHGNVNRRSSEAHALVQRQLEAARLLPLTSPWQRLKHDAACVLGAVGALAWLAILAWRLGQWTIR